MNVTLELKCDDGYKKKKKRVPCVIVMQSDNIETAKYQATQGQ